MKKTLFHLGLYIQVFLIILISGCSNSISDIMGEYNGKFTPIYTDEQDEIEPVDEEFNGNSLLLDKYVVSNKATLNLCAPSNCYSYTWTIQDPESGNLNAVTYRTMNGSSSTSQRLILYIPNSGLQGAKTYRLSLDVISNNQKHFVDYATLAVYKDYYFETGIVTIPPGRSAVTSNEISYASLSHQINNEEYTGISTRSILPPVYDIDNSNIHYYLYAQNLLTNTSISPFEINLSKIDDTTGTCLFYLPKGNYKLTLMGITEVPLQTTYEYILPRCALIGFATVDNRYDDAATFVLKSSVSETNLGYAELNCFTEGWDWDKNDSYLAGFDITTELEDSDGNIVNPTLWTDLSKNNLTTKAEYLSNPTVNYRIGIKAGTYRLKIIFNRGSEKYTYSDLIIISSGVTTKGKLAIPPVISSGITNLKLYTDGWYLGSQEFSNFTVSKSITNAVNGTIANCQVGGDISKAVLGNTVPSSPILIISGELGNYILNVTFKNNNNEYTWSYPFSIDAGKEKTETEGIPSSVIPLGIIGGG